MTNAALPQTSANVRTLRIDISRACPAVEPIPADGFSHGGRQFTAQQLAIVGQAIDAGVFYTDDLKAYCRPAWEAAHPATDQCLTVSSDGNYRRLDGMEHAQRREAANALRDAIAAAPRGTWGLLRFDWTADAGHSGVTYTMFISDGQGNACSVQTGGIHHSGRVPAYADAIADMVGYEIYLADAAEKARREQARSRACILASGLTHGATLRNVRIGNTSYSTAVVDQVLSGTWVKLHLTKRGSRNRWTWTGLAHCIQADNINPEAPAYGAVVVTEH